MLPHTPLIMSIAAAAIPTCSDYGSPELGGIAWVFARLMLTDMPLLKALSPASRRMLTHAQHLHLVTSPWSVSVILFVHSPLLESIAASARPKNTASKGDSLCLANMAWAMARLMYDNEPLLDSIAAAALPKLSSYVSS